MKNLVLSTLFAAVASQAAGCIIVADDTTGTDLGEIQMTWALKSTDAQGNTIQAGCPAGANTATLFALHEGADPASAYSDKFDCIDGSGFMADLHPGRYIVWVQLTDFNGATKFAESGSHIVQVNANNITPAPFDIYVDRGFFLVGWNLTNRFTTCAAAAGNRGISIIATVSGGANAFETLVDCAEGEGRQTISEPIPSALGAGASYTVAIDLLDRNDESIGSAADQVDKRLNYGNELEDLGLLPINVTGTP